MDDKTPANESNEQQGLNKIDLSQLQNFSFGTQWTEVKSTGPAGRRDRDFDRGDRRDRRDDAGRGGPAGQRDRRGFRKPAGAPGGGQGGEGAGAGGPAAGQRPYGGERGFRSGGGQGGERRDRPQGEGFRGGPRRDFRGGGERRDYREGGGAMERGPYISPYFTVTCYPEDVGFAALVKAVRASCRTFQLFEITKAVLEKNDRFVVVIQRKAGEKATGEQPAEGETAKAAKPAPIYMSVPDHLPFDSEEAAIQHVLKNHLDLFFTTEDIEIDPPKGNFPIINKCGITGELLGPPNYHLYQQTLQQHHASKLGRMPFERFRESITSVREPEVVQQWMDKMKKATRYTWKNPSVVKLDAAKTSAAPTDEKASEAAPAAETPVAETPATETPATETPAVENAAATPETSSAPVAPEAPAEAAAPESTAPASATSEPSFNSFDEAKAYLMTNAREKVVRAFDNVRFHGKLIEKLPPGEIKRAIEGHVERQRRFPLDTANALRGRLRREGFTIFKKGSRGVSYVCAVKRRFRVPGQVFSETITALIDFIEKNPLVPVKELPQKFLGIEVPAPAPATTPQTEGAPAPASQSQSPFAALPADQAEKLRKMTNDLRWLVMEGYVTEFSDGKLFAPPPMTAHAGKKPDEHGEEHDPVDFPEPAAAPAAPAAQPEEAAPVADAATEASPAPETAQAASTEPPAATEEPQSEGGEPVKPDSPSTNA